MNDNQNQHEGGVHMKDAMQQEQRGMGGLFFIMVTTLGFLILLMVVRMSWVSTCQNTSDNLSFMVSMSCSAYFYNSNYDDTTLTGGEGVSITKYRGATEADVYYPLSDFNTMLRNLNMIKGNGDSQFIKVEWKKATKTTKVTISPFTTMWGMKVAPNPQSTNIE